jgi:hypothetical protein
VEVSLTDQTKIFLTFVVDAILFACIYFGFMQWCSLSTLYKHYLLGVCVVDVVHKIIKRKNGK